MNNEKLKQKSAIIIGSGYGGLGAACILGKAGWKVTLIEKNEMVGGRATVFKSKGFTFDMGPSWYLMPDVFEHFFNILGENVQDHLDLIKLAPSYRIFYKDLNEQVDIYSDLKKDIPTLEAIEKGSGDMLIKYLKRAGYQYEVAKDRFMYKNYDTFRDFFTKEAALEGRKLSIFSNMDSYVGKFFKTDQLSKIMQYPLVFLGSSPYNTPAIYNIMSHIDFNMGVFYPKGGIYGITKALHSIASKYDVSTMLNKTVEKIIVDNGRATGVMVDGRELSADIVISNADIHHTEQNLLDKEHRQYSERYWKSRTLAPSALIMYLGVDKQYPSLTHHNLLFSKDWKLNFAEIFDRPQWPTDPSMYVCAPNKTDSSVAPKGMENLFVLVPIAPGLDYDEAQLESYANNYLATMESQMGLTDLQKHIVYKKIFSVKDFKQRYNSYQGTALGLAHTLRQTAIFRPNNISKKVKGLYYVGAGTNPGIGMPITLMSAELMYKRLINDKSSGPLEKI